MLGHCDPPRLVSLAQVVGGFGLSGSSVLLTGPNRSNLQDMLANLRDTEDIPPLQPPLNPPPRSPASKASDQDLGRPDDGNQTEQFGTNLADTAEGRKAPISLTHQRPLVADPAHCTQQLELHIHIHPSPISIINRHVLGCVF